MAGGDADSSSPPPNKRRKTLKSKENPIAHVAKNPSSPSSASGSCAICYLDDAIRGEIDCCEHYFCFFCIKEWSKTSTLCPLCRRRFHTIRRPAKDGVYKRQRLFKVPVRDQVYVPIGNTVAFCTVCRGTHDDSLLLLCDICDSAAHTYCVGLGNTVPRGDWFCQECTNMDEQHTDVESEDEDIIPASAFGYRMRIPRFTTQSSDITPPHVVTERCTSIANGVTTPERTLPSVSNRPTESAVRSIVSEVSTSARTLPNVSNRPTESVARSIANAVTTPARIVPSVSNRQTESVARTMDRCRNVHTRIQALRENWSGFRSGSLSFPSSSSKSGCISNQRYNMCVVIHERSSDSSQTQSLSSTSCQQPENRDTSGSRDIEKAWKMMEMARSMQHANNNSSSAVQSNVPCSRTSDSRKHTNENFCVSTSGLAQFSSSTSFQPPTNQVGCGTHDIDNASKIMDTIKSKQHVPRNTISSSSAVQHPKLLSTKPSASKEATNADSSFDILRNQQLGAWSAAHHPKLLSTKSSASKEATNADSSFDILRNQRLGAWDRGRTGMEGYKGTSRGKETIRNQSVKLENGSACSIDEGTTSSCCPKPELSMSSSSTLDVCERNIGWRDSCLESKATRSGAKSEIVSLVKINLKHLSKDVPLGYDAFKEIARLSTHTILAACGLEHSKSCKYSFPSLVCSHNEQSQLHQKSNLMPNSCQACFQHFVKDVVGSILFDPVGSAKFRGGITQSAPSPPA